MSVLLGHARAFRALSRALAQQSIDSGGGTEGVVLVRFANAYEAAAADLEQQMRAESGPDRRPRKPEGER